MSKSFVIWFGVVFVVLAGASGDAAAADGKTFRAGAFAADITPEKLPVNSNGNMQNKLADSVHDRLHARAIVLDDGGTRLAIVVVDSCMIPRCIVDGARDIAGRTTKVPPANILVSATHSHTAVTATGVFQSEPDPVYQQFLTERIAHAIQRAEANLQPAKIGWAVGRDDKQVFNRRWKMKPGTIPPDPFGGTTDTVKMNPGIMNPNLVEPSGPVDPGVSVLSLQTADGQPLALLANYSLHYVGGWPALSADYFAEFAGRIGQKLGAGPAFVGIMSNGTSGNINNVNFKGPAPPRRGPGEQIERVAESVATAAYEACQKISYRDHATLKSAEREVELGVRLPTAADLVRANDILAKAAGPVLKALPEVYARESTLLAEYPGAVKARLQAIRIGEVGIVSSPCETFVETGLAIKEHSPLKPTFTIELANGYNGYLPTPEHHTWGGYETWRARSSYLDSAAEPKIRATLLELLKTVAEK